METSRVDNLESKKTQIMSFLNLNGPNIPIKISKNIGTDSMLASAFLAELLGEKKIKLTKMRVGNSPIYYLPGQEQYLENFSHFLGSKEKEAFALLKESGILVDTQQEPAIRVALRAIKDFAFIFQYQGKLLWRYYSLNDNQALELVKKRNIFEKPKVFEKIKKVFTSHPEIKQEVKIEVKPEVKEEIKKEIIEKTIEKPKRADPKEKSEFVLNVEKYLQENKILLVKEIGFKKKEYAAKVSITSQFGQINCLCLAKDRKSITENDLKLALQEVQSSNLPVLIITPGVMGKKALERYEDLKNIIFFKQM